MNGFLASYASAAAIDRIKTLAKSAASQASSTIDSIKTKTSEAKQNLQSAINNKIYKINVNNDNNSSKNDVNNESQGLLRSESNNASISNLVKSFRNENNNINSDGRRININDAEFNNI